MLLIDKYAYMNRSKIYSSSRENNDCSISVTIYFTCKRQACFTYHLYVMSTFTIFAAKIPFSYYLKLLLLPSFFLLSGTVTILFSFASRTPSYLLYSGQDHSEIGNYSFQQAMWKR